ncbi:MAG: hypothetical protein QME52_10265 [Bacteroidota bacterium]|nr:hypothetical protein [Bacteroidota bacterium]
MQDSIKSDSNEDVIDQAKYKLFTMSTGQLMPKGTISLGTSELFLYQLCYSAEKNVQLNITSSFPISRGIKYFAIGGRVAIIEPYDVFQGISMGAEYGIFSVRSNITSPQIGFINLCTSIGSESMKGHFGILHSFFESDVSTKKFPTFIQFGYELLIYKSDEGSGMKFITETFLSRTKNEVFPPLPMIGLRFFGKKASGEIGWPFRPYFLALYENTNYLWIIPYFNFSLYF